MRWDPSAVMKGSKCSNEEVLEHHAWNKICKKYDYVVAKLEDQLGDTTNPCN